MRDETSPSLLTVARHIALGSTKSAASAASNQVLNCEKGFFLAFCLVNTTV